MENIEDRLRKASMTGSIHELQDDSPAAAGLMSEPPILEDLKSELKEGREVDEEDEEAFEDAHEEFVESHREISPAKSQQEQVDTFFFYVWPCIHVIGYIPGPFGLLFAIALTHILEWHFCHPFMHLGR